ncbi:MAG: RNA polymerase sigma factor [Cellulosilyticaceae bacterium]
MEPEKILDGLKSNDIKCYEALVDTYSRYVAAVLIKVAGNRLTNEDIEELCADVFIKFWQDRQKLTVEANKLKSYIGVMARNKALNKLRDKNIEIIPLEEDEIDYQTPEGHVLEMEYKTILNEVIDTLPEPDREIFIRRYFYLEKMGEIAIRLGINAQTVGTKLFRGKKKLEKSLRERGIAYE